MATEYKDTFANAMKTLSEETLNHRLWLSDRWADTETGKDNDVKMLEYACGPGVISMVSSVVDVEYLWIFFLQRERISIPRRPSN
jgi:hypothetical protein